MLCTFTTEHGALVIRSDDIRGIADHPDGTTFVTWEAGQELETEVIKGTASENRDRILQEELDQIGAVELHRYRTQQLLQAQPVPRGRQAQ